MSTKSDLTYGEGFYVYKEIFDGANIYLQLENVPVEVRCIENKTVVTIAVPFDVWNKIRQIPGDNSGTFYEGTDEVGHLSL